MKSLMLKVCLVEKCQIQQLNYVHCGFSAKGLLNKLNGQMIWEKLSCVHRIFHIRFLKMMIQSSRHVFPKIQQTLSSDEKIPNQRTKCFFAGSNM